MALSLTVDERGTAAAVLVVVVVVVDSEGDWGDDGWRYR